ncbi:toxin glutamine deamidase domain-containing protein [Actinoplanes derwentensis]|uniref:Papain fold toxin 1, glutamine deamidase n=1 Tax=Actinoplanes derwentensis TaxID=113562 RepID=A0A1H1Z9N8_9ACTN|nr:toxin glutamine deamidase domain-containing protein [Actinoplanes derwentensis]GID82327.1 hypothetical protein Ade03nite_12510 [Actinoplanes derwentensis]SDT30444.1 Papain fold toxin 1, glutamine deamidase [Actinoplanes derwentensis]
MTMLPSPIPHPLDFSPWDLPGWAYEALEWVVGFDWPEGNEALTWDIADQWYALADAMVGPREDSVLAAQQIIDAYGGSGTTIDAFVAAWNQIAAGGDEAPLNSLITFADAMAQMVWECGGDIEAAKLEAWIELGLFVIELIALAVTVALTLGAASPAAGGLIAATRFTIQQIFKKLVAQLAKKTIKQALKDAGKRAAKDVLTKKGLKNLGKNAWRSAKDEAREEAFTNTLVQGYQDAAGHGNFSVSELGMSALGGAAGGAAATGGGIGGNGKGGVFRGAASDVLGEIGGSAVSGDFPSFEDLAKAGTSGAAGTSVSNTGDAFKDVRSDLNGGDLKLNGSLPASSGPSNTSSGTGGSSPSLDLSGGGDSGSSSGSSSGGGSSSYSGDGSSSSADSSSSSSGSSYSGSSSSASSYTTASHYSPSTSTASSSDGGSYSASSSSSSSFTPSSSSSSSDHGSAPSVSAQGDGGSSAASSNQASSGPAASTPAGYSHSSSSDNDVRLSSFAPPAESPAQTSGNTGMSSPASSPVNTAPSGGNPSTNAPMAFAPGTVNSGPLGGAPNPNVSLATGGPTPSSFSPSTTPPSTVPQSVTSPSTPNISPATTSPGSPTLPNVNTSPSNPPPTGTSPQGPSPATTTPGPSTPATANPATNAPTSTNPSTPSAATPNTPNTTGPANPSTPSPKGPGPAGSPPVPDAGRGNDAIAPAGMHGSPNLTSRTPDEARFEQAYLDQGARNKKTVENTIRDRALQAFDKEITRTRDAQNFARREAQKAFRLNFSKRAHYQNMEAHYQQQEQDALHRRALAMHFLSQPYKVHLDPDSGPNHQVANDESAFHVDDSPIWHNDQSALTGNDNPPNVRTTRPYGERGGLRPPLPMHQADLERVFPLDSNGRPERAADPRSTYLKLMNDGGPGADPQRGVNCLDCALSFLETYVHGRPTVSAARTADSYGFGQPDTLDGEKDGHYRAEQATGSGFTSLTQRWLEGNTRPAADVKAEVDAGFQMIIDTLKTGGHGSAAIIINVWEGNSAHAWNAVNHNGEIVFVDPQTGEYTDFSNMVSTAANPQFGTHYGHTGLPNRNNVVELNALMIDGQGNPMSVPNTHQSPHYSRQPTPPPPLAWQQQQAQLQQQTNPLPPPPPVPGPPPPPSPVNTQPDPGPAVETRVDTTPPGPPAVDTQPTPDVQEPTDSDPLRESSTADPSPQPEQDTTPEPEDSKPQPHDFDPLSVLDPHSMDRPPTDDPFAVLDLSPKPAPTPEPTVDTEPDNARPDEVKTENDLTLADTSDTPVPQPAPPVDREAEQRTKDAYHFELDSKRRGFDTEHRDNLAHDLRRQARARDDEADEHARRNRVADTLGDPADAARREQEREQMRAEADSLREQANQVERGGPIGDVELSGSDWERANETWADTSPGPVETDDRSALTGDGEPRPIDTTRRYNERGGLRPPLQIHQTDLERAMPRDQDGNVVRLADPREGAWFGLQNDGGPEADPTRSNNCGDNALSFYESYMHARPRVSAPRTFDGYHRGDVNSPIDPETGVIDRIEQTTNSTFEGLTDVGDLSPEDARNQIRMAESRLHHHLLGTGHGSFAFITTQDQAGRTHIYEAVNQNGTILYVDPQTRAVRENSPLYTNTGRGVGPDVVRMDALTLDGQNRPRPLHTGDAPNIATDPSGTSWQVADSVVGPAKGARITAPHPRHTVSGARGARSKDNNTVYLRGYESYRLSDTQAIAEGRAPWNSELKAYVIEGRRYNVKDKKTVYPLDGPGMVKLERAEYSALVAIADAYGDVSAATALTRNPFIANFPGAAEKAKAIYDGTYEP